ncbi:MAG: FAD:protein transferase [Acidimicrobiaceae bacterium]|nr:FAD:protein transferase [Acidimicrobiaceae bacterium]
MTAELRFRAMGTDVHLLVVGGPPMLVTLAKARIDDLEQRWSRFLPDSEVSRLTSNAGHPVRVSDDTVLLVRRAIEGWRMSGGAFDPTVLGAMIRSGYSRSFDEMRGESAAGHSSLFLGCTDIEVTGNTVRLPLGTGFDPGGIGKGLAADIVAAEVMAGGAAGVCVSIGGDVRVTGEAPDGAWTIAVEHPWSSDPLVRLGMTDGAVATSTTLLRRWLVGGHARHHLVDPATGLTATTDLNLATVVAGTGWVAEVLAKAVLLKGAEHPFDIVGGTGAEAVAVGEDGRVHVSDGLPAFLGGVPVPSRLTEVDRGQPADLTS